VYSSLRQSDDNYPLRNVIRALRVNIGHRQPFLTKAEVEIWWKSHKRTRGTRLAIRLSYNTIYGRIYHRFTARTTSGLVEFSKMENGDRRHLGYLKFRNVESRGSRGSMCVTVPNFVEISQTAAEIYSRISRPPKLGLLRKGSELDPHLTQCGLGRGLPPYQVVS